jgi:putative flippase GtrA
MKKTKKKNLIKMLVQFIKLNIAGNILFWVTYIGFAVFDGLLHWPELPALATASIIAHVLFFFLNKEWVFVDKSGRRKAGRDMMRFVIFMGFNYFLNLGIIHGLSVYAGVTPYIGQFLAGFFFAFWTFIGMRWWVFAQMRHHAITVEKPRRQNGKQPGSR